MIRVQGQASRLRVMGQASCLRVLSVASRDERRYAQLFAHVKVIVNNRDPDRDKAEPDAENAFKQDETKTIVPSMEESCTVIEKAISNNATAIENEDLPGKAERVHDELQTNYNNEASTNAQKCAESHQSSDS